MIRKYFWLTLCICFLLPGNLRAADKLLQKTDFSYLGAFRVPQGDMGDSGRGLTYGGTAIAYNPANNSLFIVGHDQAQRVGEISIPANPSPNPGSMPTASVIQNLYDITDGHVSLSASGNKIGGLSVYNNQLIGTVYVFYDANNAASTSHFKSGMTLSATNDFQGMYMVTPSPSPLGGTSAGFVSGYMSPVPDNSASGGTNWQAALGGPYLTGSADYSIVGRTSFGPAAFSFDPAAIASGTTASALVYYDLSHQSLGVWGHGLLANQYVSIADNLPGMIFPAGTQTVVFTGMHGTGNSCYGEAAECNDPVYPYKGTHAYPYEIRAYAYDAAYLAKVKAGAVIQSADLPYLAGNPVVGQVIKPWNLKPYSTWTLPITTSQSLYTVTSGSSAYDPASKRWFVVQPGADNSPTYGLPLVHVFQVNTGASALDTTLPTVSITAPANNATASGTVSISASASDNLAVSRLEFYVNGILQATDTSTPYLYSWNTASLAAGSYTLTAKAYDAAGNMGQSGAVSVTVVNDTTAPVISLSAPSNNAAVSGTVAITANATDNIAVSRVDFYENGTLIASGNVAPYSTNWNTTSVVNGSYIMTARAFDAAGNSSQSGNVTVTVNNAVTDIPVAGSACNVAALPITGTRIINVATESQLQAAVSSVQAGDTIVLANGTYNLSSTLYINGKDNVTIRGASGCSDVVLVGKGMDNASYGSTIYGIWTSSVNTTVAHLTIRDTYDNQIMFNAGAQSPHVYSVKLLDAGSQFIKSNPTDVANGIGVNNAVIEYSWMEYTNGTPNHSGSVGYTNGISAHAVDGWTIRGNTFKNFHTPDTAAYLWNPAVLIWNHSKNTITENNLFINVDRAVAYGIQDNTGSDHTGGVIRNNMVYLAPNLMSATRKANSDGLIIIWDSPASAVYHNTVLTNGNVTSSMEFRFITSGALVSNNLTDAPIASRDGGTYTQNGNYLSATAGMFVDPLSGNLRLLDNAATRASVIDKASVLALVPTDIDGDSRPSGLSADIGADELQQTTVADSIAPTVVISSPIANATLSATVAITATASDNVGVSRVEFFVDSVLQASDTASPYSFSWNTTSAANASHVLTAKAYDAAGNIGQSAAVTVTVNNTVVVPPSYASLWAAGTVPVLADAGPDSAVELGVKFRSDSAGSISGIRFYKASTNTGTHVGNLWSSSGTRLATATFTGETASGWQSVSFAAPVTIAANTVYVASYHTNTGHYSADQNYFASTGVDRAPLHAPASTTSSPNGVFVYGTASAFPNQGWNSTNYWVDVAFTASPSVADTSAPVVAIASPSTSASVSGTATVSVSASDNVGVSRVELYVNNVLQAADSASPYSFSWNTAALSNGSYSLSAKGYDAAGNVGQSAAVSVTVNNPAADTTAPVVSIASPSAGAAVSGTATVSVSASDNVGVSKVELYVNNVLQATDSASPYSFSWNTAALSNGSYSLSAKAYDAAGNVRQSAAVSVTVSNVITDTTAPSIRIISPSTVRVTGTVYVAVSTSDNVGVAKVEFYLNGKLNKTLTVAPFSYSIPATSFQLGSYNTLYAKAYDAAGNVMKSTTIKFSVRN